MNKPLGVHINFTCSYCSLTCWILFFTKRALHFGESYVLNGLEHDNLKFSLLCIRWDCGPQSSKYWMQCNLYKTNTPLSRHSRSGQNFLPNFWIFLVNSIKHNLYKADTVIKQTILHGPNGVRLKRFHCNSWFAIGQGLYTQIPLFSLKNCSNFCR